MALQKQREKKKMPLKSTYYQENEEYHKRFKKESRERYHKEPDYKKATLERAKKRYHEDAEYRAATIQRAKERYRRLKQLQ